MQVRTGVATRLAGVALALALGACSSGNGLATGTLFGGGDKAPPAPRPETATDRALYVATTAARASRCGYVFDPAVLRQSYLAFEAQQSAAADQLAKTEKSYDYTADRVGKAIAGEADYCSEAQTGIIKRDLMQVLGGNYSSPDRAAQAQAEVGWWSAQKSTAPMDREKVFNPRD
jgi:hypothetical protein